MAEFRYYCLHDDGVIALGSGGKRPFDLTQNKSSGRCRI